MNEKAIYDNPVIASQAAGAALAEPNRIKNGGMYAVIPEGWKVEDLEQFAERPARVKATVDCETTDSLGVGLAWRW